MTLTEVALAGHGMGTGEIVRYLGTYGSDRISRVALLAPLPPFVLRSEGNPAGLELVWFDEQIARARNDPADFLDQFVEAAFATDGRGGSAGPAETQALNIEAWPMPEANYATVPGAPYAVAWTHADEVNRMLVDFLGR